MAIDARISLAGRVPDAGQAINIFERALNSSQARGINAAQEQRRAELAPLQQQQAQQNVAINEQTLASNQAAADQSQELRILKSVNDFAIGNQSIINEAVSTGNIKPLQEAMVKRLALLKQQNLPTQETEEGLAMLGQGNLPGVVSAFNDSVKLYNQSQGNQQKQFALQSNAPITDPTTGQVSTPVFNPATGQTQLVPVEGAIQETPNQVSSREFKAAQDQAALDVETTGKKETIKKTVARTSELKKEFSERRRLAARSTRRVKEAQKLAQNATQGVAGQGKLALARLFPGIDASNEGALSSAFKGLALDELQKFKGPTTDFEFAVTEDIAGSLGSSASANIARLASLERANWFIDRESQQFNDHVKAGHSPDEYFFNFNELVTPKKGGKSYSLQSLQDTAVANHISIDEVMKRLAK
tara:strand:+ start:1535 stop:2785 length:1251 start_codon:yes stop_codon:yes gene_type:complete